MVDRVRPRDLTFLEEETPQTPLHNATIEIFDPGDSGLDYARLVELIRDRIPFVPRYRQRLSEPHTGIVRWPDWIAHEAFDIGPQAGLGNLRGRFIGGSERGGKERRGGQAKGQVACHSPCILSGRGAAQSETALRSTSSLVS